MIALAVGTRERSPKEAPDKAQSERTGGQLPETLPSVLLFGSHGPQLALQLRSLLRELAAAGREVSSDSAETALRGFVGVAQLRKSLAEFRPLPLVGLEARFKFGYLGLGARAA
jgi:hypothetical protein